MIKLALIEDDPGIRKVLTRYLSAQEEFDCLLVSESIEDFMERSQTIPALDVILSDIGLPGESGIEGIRTTKSRYPEAKILMISIFQDSDRIFKAICNGALGYLVKSTPLPKIKEAIINVYQGDAAMSPSIARKVIEYFHPKKDNRKEQLTAREKEVVQALVDGLSYKMVADRLEISFETVKQHIKNIYRKLEINSKSELIARSFRGEI